MKAAAKTAAFFLSTDYFARMAVISQMSTAAALVFPTPGPVQSFIQFFSSKV